jgi:hypothetical protein
MKLNEANEIKQDFIKLKADFEMMGLNNWNRLDLNNRDKLIFNRLCLGVHNDKQNKYFRLAYRLVLNKHIDYNFILLDISYSQLLQILDAAIKYVDMVAFQ